MVATNPYRSLSAATSSGPGPSGRSSRSGNARAATCSAGVSPASTRKYSIAMLTLSFGCRGKIQLEDDTVGRDDLDFLQPFHGPVGELRPQRGHVAPPVLQI